MQQPLVVTIIAAAGLAAAASYVGRQSQGHL
jgi:hypothetical protein